MNFLRVVYGKSSDENYLNLGDLIGLWNIARNKIIGLSVLSIFYMQARDNELKDLIKNGFDFAVEKHVDKIQKVLKERGYSFPTQQNWQQKFGKNAEAAVSSIVLDDQEIATSMREIIRLTLSLEAEGLKNSIDKSIRELIFSIYEDDNKGYSGVLALQRKKNWADFPPAILS